MEYREDPIHESPHRNGRSKIQSRPWFQRAFLSRILMSMILMIMTILISHIIWLIFLQDLAPYDRLFPHDL